MLGSCVRGRQVPIDIDRLIVSRLLVQANSGAGKSWALRRLLEQTHGQVQQLVLDVEGEFYTLREKGDFILARAGERDRDCPAEPHGAALLARKLLELGVSAVVDIYELKAHERLRFARLFLDALVNAPRELWRPCLVVVDEAHVFCPQKGEAESAGAMIDLMTRGRKRGFCGVLATQRLSKLHKDAAAEANNKLIGRSALDVDMERAGDELGFSKSERTRLRTLEPGHFFAFGPALSPSVVEVLVGPVETTHPKPGQRAAPAPPARAKVQKVLGQLADLPREAEEEARTLADAKGRIRALERELAAAQKGAPRPAPAERVEVPVLKDAQVKRLEDAIARIEKQSAKDLERAERLFEAGAELKGALGGARPPARAAAARPASSPAPRIPRVPAAERPPTEGLSGPEQRILDAIAWLEGLGQTESEQTAVAFLAGYTVGGGAFNNPRGALRTKGLIVYRGDRLSLTDAGRELARAPEVALTADELQARVLDRLPGPEGKLLRALIAAYPEALAVEELAARAGYEAGGGAFNNPKGRLRTLGLIDYPERGLVVAKSVLFLETRE